MIHGMLPRIFRAAKVIPRIVPRTLRGPSTRHAMTIKILGVLLAPSRIVIEALRTTLRAGSQRDRMRIAASFARISTGQDGWIGVCGGATWNLPRDLVPRQFKVNISVRARMCA